MAPVYEGNSQENNSSWKFRIKDNFDKLKKNFQNLVDEDKSNKKISDVKPIGPILTVTKCPVCQSNLASELLDRIKEKKTVICEKCGYEIGY